MYEPQMYVLCCSSRGDGLSVAAAAIFVVLKPRRTIERMGHGCICCSK